MSTLREKVALEDKITRAICEYSMTNCLPCRARARAAIAVVVEACAKECWSATDAARIRALSATGPQL